MKRAAPIDASPFPDEMLNVALDMSLEWGPNWLKPINERIRAKYPELSEAQAQTLNDWCVEAREFAYAEVEIWYPLEVENKIDKAMESTREKYPRIDAHNLSHLFNQGMYYAWHG